MVQVFFNLIREAGVGRLYRGIMPLILMEAPKRAVKFGSNELYKPLFANKKGELIGPGAVAAGALTGVTEACVIVPFELVKVRMQAKENVGKYRNSFHAVQCVWAEEGLTGFYKGLESTVWRNGVWNAAYFGLIHDLNKRFALPPEKKTHGRQLFVDFLVGFIAGVVATTLNTPFDVVKSRIQSVRLQAAGLRKYNWTIPSLFTVLREEGLRALYKGYAPKVLRLGPGGGILKVVFDKVSQFLAHQRQKIDKRKNDEKNKTDIQSRAPKV